MIEMHSKYDSMHTNVMFYDLFFINNHVLSCCMLSTVQSSLNPRSTGLMKCIGCESLPLSCSHWNSDRPLRWCHVICIIKCIKTLAVGSRSDALDVFFVGLVSTVITPIDQRLRLKRNPMNQILPRTPLT